MWIGDAWRDSRHRRDHFNWVGVELQKLADDDVGLEVDGMRIGADEGTTKNARRPARHVVSLQRFEQRQLDFRPLRDRGEGNLLSFTLLAQSSAETLSHAGHLAGRETRSHALPQSRI